jgi:2-polyprenyl-3-methyl-5-hydroxy-6-metoxy-1,4-benzoquinol methylase
MENWERHYLSRDVIEQTPAPVLIEHTHLLPASAKVLDYACGLAANGCWLAHQGYAVTAWDSSNVAVSKVNQYAEQFSIDIHAEVRDLEINPPRKAEFDVVIVSHFLHRPSLHQLMAILNPGGLLFYQTFCGERLHDGPSNADFRLQPGELLRVFADLKLLFYREDGATGNLTAGCRDQALFIGQKV